MADFIDENFVPFTVNLSETPGLFHRFGALWTPTVLILSPKGEERYRLEGFLPRDEFLPWLELGLARLQFVSKNWNQAEQWYEHVAKEHRESVRAPEAVYWRGVCRYQATSNPKPLGDTAEELRQQHPNSEWAMRSSVWLAEVETTR